MPDFIIVTQRMGANTADWSDDGKAPTSPLRSARLQWQTFKKMRRDKDVLYVGKDERDREIWRYIGDA